MPCEIIPHAGWSRNARLFNAEAELIVTLDVGPRILAYRRLDGSKDGAGRNVLKQYEEQLGGTGEKEWKIRGGHRLWLAPEDEVITYAADNSPVVHEASAGENTITAGNGACAPWRIEKEMVITLDGRGSGVTIEHRITNRGKEPLAAAPWALTVMAPGGMAVIPQPPLGQHPRDLLPNRRYILWPYTELSDARWRLGTHLLTLQQTATGKPTKIGLLHAGKWAGYILGRAFFCKSVPLEEGAVYPDDGCNCEVFSNHEMLEVETLGALRTLAPGESAGHTEHWSLHELSTHPEPGSDDAALADHLSELSRTRG